MTYYKCEFLFLNWNNYKTLAKYTLHVAKNARIHSIIDEVISHSSNDELLSLASNARDKELLYGRVDPTNERTVNQVKYQKDNLRGTISTTFRLNYIIPGLKQNYVIEMKFVEQNE